MNDSALTPRSPLVQLARAAISTGFVLLLSISLALALRRIAGETRVFDGPSLLLLLVATTSTAGLVRQQRPQSSSRRRPAPLAPSVTQSLVRTTSADGSETITGQLRAVLRPGERTTFLHVAFCPPLPSVPQIKFHQIAGAAAEIKLTQSQTYGARFDLRLLREFSTAAEVQIKFTARLQ